MGCGFTLTRPRRKTGSGLRGEPGLRTVLYDAGRLLILVHASVLALPFGLFGLSVLGLVAAVTIWRAFFPPAFHRRMFLSQLGGGPHCSATPCG